MPPTDDDDVNDLGRREAAHAGLSCDEFLHQLRRRWPVRQGNSRGGVAAVQRLDGRSLARRRLG
jgi:hypothetical protein